VIACDGGECEYTVVPGGTSRRARISLNRCIGNYETCRFGCTNEAVLLDYQWKECLNRCDANHFACVDSAMDLTVR